MEVSIIVPAYNEQKNISKLIDSILNQKYKSFELIIVDNNSTDKTKEIIRRYQNKDKRIKYLFEPLRKRGAARYLGELNSKGKIVLMTDADCVVQKNWIKNMIEPIIEKKAIAVQGTFKTIKLNYWTEQAQRERDRNMLMRKNDKKIGLLHSGNFAIRRDILKKIGYSNPRIFSGNDTDLEIRLKKEGYEILFKKVDVYHLDPDNSIKTVKKFFYRARWNKKIINNYGSQYFIKSKNIDYFKNIFLELVYRNKNFKYDFITGISWRLGKLF